MRTLTAIAVIAAFAGSIATASAADLRSRTSMKDYEEAPAPIWEGLYIGRGASGSSLEQRRQLQH